MKAKVHKVEVLGKTFLVNAITRSGAIRDLFDALKDIAIAQPATGQDMYEAGTRGEMILGADRYANAVDPNQLPLDGIPEQA